jgi:hypothetical protein
MIYLLGLLWEIKVTLEHLGSKAVWRISFPCGSAVPRQANKATLRFHVRRVNVTVAMNSKTNFGGLITVQMNILGCINTWNSISR